MKRSMYYPLVIVMLMFLAGAYLYPQLPDQIPTHWNAQGEVDDYSSRDVGVFMMPVISLAIYLIFLAIPHMAVFKKNVKEFYDSYAGGFFTILMLFMFGVQLFSLFAGLGSQFEIMYFMVPAISMLFGYIGYILPKVKRNFFIGIRTPWTLASDRVWKKTHEMGGKLFMGSAVIMLLSLLFPPEAFWVSIVAIIAASFYMLLYSYLEFRKEKRENGIDRE